LSKTSKKIVNLALQGGGSHGAFTWGALEGLLEDGRVDFRTISGTSAGSMNAVVLVYGLIVGGAAKATALLEQFWRKVSESGSFGMPSNFGMQNAARTAENLFDPMGLMHGGMMAAGAYAGFDMMSKWLSPYQFNPLGVNPLRDILLSVVDFKVFSAATPYNLFVAATDVLQSRLKTFTDTEVTVDAVLASACLPQLFQAVKINDHYYWDGGYMGNPTLFPLTNCPASQDILIFQIDPIARREVPRTPGSIADRINEISFNSPLLVELRGIRLINQLIHAGHLTAEQCGLRELYLHIVSDDAKMATLPLETKFNTDWDFLNGLRQSGYQSAKKWLEENFATLGSKSSIDIDALVA